MYKLLIIAASFFPAIAFANAVWPALYLETRLFSFWAIGIGLVIEFITIKWLFTLSVKKSIIAVVFANLLSSVAGIVLIPLAGIVWEIFPGSVMYWAFGIGTFNPVTWIATFILGCLVNGLLEGSVYKRWFVPEFRFKSKAFLWLLAANSLSVGAAFISLLLKPVHP